MAHDETRDRSPHLHGSSRHARRLGPRPQRVALRARIGLPAADGVSNNGIVKRPGVSRPTVILWRDRFSAKGPISLTNDAPRGPSSKRLDAATVAALRPALRTHQFILGQPHRALDRRDHAHRRIRRGTFHNVPVLAGILEVSIQANKDPKPIIRTTTAAAIIAKIESCKAVAETLRRRTCLESCRGGGAAHEEGYPARDVESAPERHMHPMATRPRLILIDGYSLLFRAHMAYGSADTLRTRDGRPTGAVHGFTSMLISILEKEKPDAVYVAWDAPGPTFRDELFDSYKANRPETDPDLKAQFEVVRRLVDAFDVACAEVPGFEADDLIGTLARAGVDEGYDVLIVTGDSDQLQLVSDAVCVRMTTRGVSESVDFDADKVRDKYGIGPELVADFKALVGDKSDNVPGVPGVGAVTAARLLREYGSLEAILDGADGLPERTATDRKVKEALRSAQETARLARSLTTIRTDVPVDRPIRRYAPTSATWEAVRRVFADLEFRGLAQRLPKSDAAQPPAKAVAEPAVSENPPVAEDAESVAAAECVEIANDEELAVALRAVKEAGWAAIRLDMADAPSGPKRWRGVAFATEGPRACYVRVDTAGIETGMLPGSDDSGGYSVEPTVLSPLLLDPDVRRVGHDVKGLMHVLRRHGITSPEYEFDTMVAGYLLDPGHSALGLDDLAAKYLGDDGRAALNQHAMAECRAADRIGRLRSVLRRRLERDGLLDVMQKIEMPLVSVLASVEAQGIVVDRGRLSALSAEMSARIGELTEAIHTMAGEKFAIGSTQQLQRILFEKLQLPAGKRIKTGLSTAAAHLETLAQEHEIARLILEYREVTKLKSTYVDALPKLIDPRTGRVHTTLHQTVTTTGRLASSDPNLQNIPVRSEAGRIVRRAFVAPAGMTLVSCDYSQIELRVFAHFTRDPELRRAFEADEDIHSATALRLFGVGPDEMTPEMRRRAKTVNFAVIYGQSDFGLSQTLGIPLPEAREFIDRYFRQFPGVKAWTREVLDEARRKGYVETLFGRRRYLPELTSANRNVRLGAERAAVNMPIQGTAADLMKLAMIAVAHDIRDGNRPWNLLLQVHDELLLEAPADQAVAAASRVRRLMEEACSLEVPLRVDAKIGPNWADMNPVR